MEWKVWMFQERDKVMEWDAPYASKLSFALWSAVTGTGSDTLARVGFLWTVLHGMADLGVRSAFPGFSYFEDANANPSSPASMGICSQSRQAHIHNSVFWLCSEASTQWYVPRENISENISVYMQPWGEGTIGIKEIHPPEIYHVPHHISQA